MESIESPRPAPATAVRTQGRKPGIPPEPPTGRALWPTFMRRTLDDEYLRRPPAPRPQPRKAD